MDLIDKLNTSYKFVSGNSKHVKINYANIDKILETFDVKNFFWLENNTFGIMDMSTEDIINFLLILHTVGDYCFWGEPKWKIKTQDSVLDGSIAMLYVLFNRYKKNKNFNLKYSEFYMLLNSNTKLELFDDRYRSLLEMNKFLKGRAFYDIIKNINSTEELLRFVIDSFSYFDDKAMYNNNEILFYKRAQLLVSDIIHVLNIKEGANIDYSCLIGCADYKIPQVMRGYGMLEYESELAFKVDNNIRLDENSECEVEIRANELEVIDYISNKLNNYNRMDINDCIWLLGQDKTKCFRPYHKTLTHHY